MLSSSRAAASITRSESGEVLGSFKTVRVRSPLHNADIPPGTSQREHAPQHHPDIAAPDVQGHVFFVLSLHLAFHVPRARSPQILCPSAAGGSVAGRYRFLHHFILDDSDVPSLSSFIASLRKPDAQSPTTDIYSSLYSLLPSFQNRSLLLSVAAQPSPSSLALLEQTALECSAPDRAQVTASHKKVAEESAKHPIPILDEVNDIAIDLISSSSDSYVESDSAEEPAPVYESACGRAG